MRIHVHFSLFLVTNLCRRTILFFYRGDMRAATAVRRTAKNSAKRCTIVREHEAHRGKTAKSLHATRTRTGMSVSISVSLESDSRFVRDIHADLWFSLHVSTLYTSIRCHSTTELNSRRLLFTSAVSVTSQQIEMTPTSHVCKIFHFTLC